MSIYRFRISFEDYDDIIREIDIRSNQTFNDLHISLHKSTGYNPEKSSSFYVSNDQWIKNEEIAYLPTQRKTDRGIALMDKTKLSSFIDDPHQKFYYTYNFDRPYDFHVELIKILDEEKGKEYPCLNRSVGEAPKALGAITAPVIPSEDTEEEFDFLHETQYGIDDAEEQLDDVELGDEAVQNTDEEEADDFPDAENFSSEDFEKDDY